MRVEFTSMGAQLHIEFYFDGLIAVLNDWFNKNLAYRRIITIKTICGNWII